MKDIFSIDFREVIRKVSRRELKERFGIKTSKDKDKHLKSCEGNDSKVFGKLLEKVPSKNVKDEEYFCVPIFLIDAFEYLEQHFKIEGLFRKSGSVGRQKILKEILEKEGTCCSCEFTQPHDVASLIKHFFRELPDPLLTFRLTPSFLKCISLANNKDIISALALCCLLLPDEHLRVLKYFTKFINEVANHSIESKMTLANLAIVFAPNLMSTAGKDKTGEKSMKEVTEVVNLLFKNFHLIGKVPDNIFEKAMQFSNDGGFCSSSGDELDNEVENERKGRCLERSDKGRDRSKSITGFIKRNFKANEQKGAPKHPRSGSDRLPLVNSGMNPKKKTSCSDILPNSDDKDMKKRRNTSKSNMSPVRKSPRLAKKEEARLIISKPALLTLSNQVILSPRRHLQNIQNTVDMTDNTEAKPPGGKCIKARPISLQNGNESRAKEERKADHFIKKTGSKVNLERSKSAYVSKTSSSSIDSRHTLDDSTSTIQYRESLCPDKDGKIRQPVLSRTTQKPHVCKTRRASTLDRRRARYASQRTGRKLPKIPGESQIEPRKIAIGRFEPNKTNGLNTGFSDNEAFSADETPTSLVTPTVHEKWITQSNLSLKESRQNWEKFSNNDENTKPIRHSMYDKSPEFDVSVTPSSAAYYQRLRSKPPTPYNVTPQVGMRKSKPAVI